MQALKEHKWTSPTPLTRSRLEKERDEFWDTSPNYGVKENNSLVSSLFSQRLFHCLIGPSNTPIPLAQGDEEEKGGARDKGQGEEDDARILVAIPSQPHRTLSQIFLR